MTCRYIVRYRIVSVEIFKIISGLFRGLDPGLALALAQNLWYLE